ncbi:MAG: hypothetical protein HZA07_04820 [Nitrospirae bacterium]|nr:hypothetical protein [Nitrospirota bacterium]
MRTLIYVPIIHMDVDLGSLASDVAKRGIASLGEKVWERHVETVNGFWDSINKYFEKLEVSNFKVYQDGMVADGAMGQKILDEGLKSGSKNYEIISKLIQRGAILVKTEDFSLVKKERDWFLKIINARTLSEKLLSYLKYRLIKNGLLRKRDRFIANRINETLNQGETGILFIGACHNIIPKLARDIRVKELKDTKKIREYQKSLLHGKGDTKRFEELTAYIVEHPQLLVCKPYPS